MATLWRALAQQGRIFTQLRALKRQIFIQPACFISTSKKNKDVASTLQPMEKSEELKKLEEHFANTDPLADKPGVVQQLKDNWVSYGYENKDPELDYFVHHVTMFITISLCLCWGAFILAYLPDFKLQNWAHREAFLELDRREREGLPLVNPELVDPATITLPSDEELGDTEIIV